MFKALKLPLRNGGDEAGLVDRPLGMVGYPSFPSHYQG